MKRSRALVLVLSIVLALIAPAFAGDVGIDILSAAQYEYGYFFAYVTAHDTAPLVDAHLLVDGVLIVPDKVDQYASGPSNGFYYSTWKFYKNANDVVKPGDVVTAVVTDATGSTAQRNATCAASTKKKSDVSAFCQ
jgi:hypothetical protein